MGDISSQAKDSPSFKMNLDLRNGENDTSQRMLNAIEPGTLVPIHRHRDTSETVVCLRGKLVEAYYDDLERMCTESIVLTPNGQTVALNIPAGQWHTVKALESGTVILEVKDGRYEPMSDEDVLNSRLTLEQKKRYLNECLFITRGRHDTWELAKLVCFYFNQCGVDGADKDLVIEALSIYQSGDNWEQKISLINKCNGTWEYDTERENKMLNSLGGGYNRRTYPRGWAEFDINEHNRTLLDYLKDKGHYINKIEEKEGKFYVTFKHS